MQPLRPSQGGTDLQVMEPMLVVALLIESMGGTLIFARLAAARGESSAAAPSLASDVHSKQGVRGDPGQRTRTASTGSSSGPPIRENTIWFSFVRPYCFLPVGSKNVAEVPAIGNPKLLIFTMHIEKVRIRVLFYDCKAFWGNEVLF